MRPIFVLFPLYFLLLGCQNSDDAVQNVLALTSKESYTVGEPVTIAISSETGQTIMFQTCCADNLVYYIDRLESGVWTQYKTSGGGIPCKAMCPGFPIYVSPSHPHQSSIGSEIDKNGTYRFRFLYSAGESNNQELPSNSFKVE